MRAGRVKVETHGGHDWYIFMSYTKVQEEVDNEELVLEGTRAINKEQYDSLADTLRGFGWKASLTKGEEKAALKTDDLVVPSVIVQLKAAIHVCTYVFI